MPTHAEKRILSCSPRQLFDLVADIERYPDFLPWCMAARIRKREGDLITADLVIDFKMFRQRIDVAYEQGPFKYLSNHWVFEDHPQGCAVDFYVDFEFRSRLLQRLIEPLFSEAVRRMVAAFETRAKVLYGRSERPARS